MKIIYREGDIFSCIEKDGIQFIAHGCNAQGGMGAGFALTLKNKLPYAYEEYREHYLSKGLMLGEVVCASCPAPGDLPLVFNCITQQYYGREKGKKYVSYEAVRECIVGIDKCFKRWADIFDIAEVVMPKIGAGLAGGDWDIISKIIEDNSRYFQPVVYVLENEKK